MSCRSFVAALLAAMPFSLFSAETTFEKIDGAVQLQVEKKWIPGAVLGFYENGQITYATYGETEIGSGRRPSEHNLYEIGSISKVMTGLILAGLHNQKIVNLNDPILKYLPELKNTPVGQITLVELATHTSGLPRLPLNFNPSNGQDPYADYTEEHLIDYLRSVTELNRPVPFTWDNYSNLGFGLLGHVLSLASNKPYEILLKNYVTEPLEMSSTVVRLNPAQQALFATPYRDDLEPTLPWNFNSLVGAGGVRSTASDLMKFLLAHRAPEKTSIAENLKLAMTIHAQNGAESIGLGWGIEPGYLGHSGGTGGFRSEVILSTDGKKALMTLVNSANQVQCVKAIFLAGADCLPDFGYELTDAELKERAGVYSAKTPAATALTFVIEQKFMFLTYEIPKQEKGRLSAKTADFFHIQDIAQIEFIRNSSTGFIDRMCFTQNGFSIELEKE